MSPVVAAAAAAAAATVAEAIGTADTGTFDTDTVADNGGTLFIEPQIDLTKSLHYLSLHGFDVSGKSQAVSSPRGTSSDGHSSLKTQTPLMMMMMHRKPDTLNDGSVSTDSVSQSTTCTWSDDSRTVEEPEDDLDCSSYNQFDTVVKESSVQSNHWPGSFRATIDTNESDTVEVTLDRSLNVPEQHQGRNVDCASLFVDHAAVDEEEDCSYYQTLCPPLTPQTPVVAMNFCGFPSAWCDSKSTSLILDENASLRGVPMCTVPDGWCPYVVLDSFLQEAVQSQICESLGILEGSCWQLIYPKNNSDASSPATDSTDNLTPATTISRNEDFSVAQHHRLYNSVTRRTRVDLIRRELHPFSGTPSTNLQPFAPFQRHPLTQSKSFNLFSSSIDATKTCILTAPEKPLLQRRESKMLHNWECGDLAFAAPLLTHSSSPPSSNKNTAPLITDIDDGYDSDPEDYHINKENFIQFRQRSTPPQVSNTVQGFLNERCTFILHSEKSVAVIAWIELGQRLCDRIIMPQLFWKPMYPDPDHGTDARSSIDLLNICRVLKVTDCDREKHPFAVLDRLMTVQTVSHAPLLLQARSTADRDRWMSLLKLTVSTLAAKFLTNDPAALTVFFADNYFSAGPFRSPFDLEDDDDEEEEDDDDDDNDDHQGVELTRGKLEAWI